MKLFRKTPPDSSTAFRLPKEMLSTIDTICNDLYLTRSQPFRRSVTEFIKSLGHERNVFTGTNRCPNTQTRAKMARRTL